MIIDQIHKDLLELAKQSDKDLADIYHNIDDICQYNSDKILEAFIENVVSYSDFADINGYGNYDEGRNKLEKIFAKVLGCEDALVRPQIMSGTNAIYLGLSALLRHGDVMLSITGDPYDSLQEMIGIIGDSTQSLKAYGVKYEKIDLVDNDFDDKAIDVIYQSLYLSGYIHAYSVSNKRRIPYEVILTQKGLEMATAFIKKSIPDFSTACAQWLPVLINAAQLYMQIKQAS